MDFIEKIKKELEECKSTSNSDVFKVKLINVLKMLIDKVVFLDDMACTDIMEYRKLPTLDVIVTQSASNGGAKLDITDIDAVPLEPPEPDSEIMTEGHEPNQKPKKAKKKK